MTDVIANALINIKNHDNASKQVCVIRPNSKLLKEILRVLRENKYIDNVEIVEDGREGIVKVLLNGSINECKAVKPRYPVKKDGYEKFEKRYLPSRDIGLLIVSTPQGIMTHHQAIENNTGGRLLAFIY